jgi:hypothetical protein
VAFFLLRSTSLALCGIRDGVQAGLWDLFTARLALAETAVFDPLDCRFNLIELVFVVSQLTRREFPVGIVARKLLHVGRYAGGSAVGLQGIIFHLSHVTSNACPQSQEFLPMRRQVGVRHFVVP